MVLPILASYGGRSEALLNTLFLVYACASFLGQLFMTFFNFAAVVQVGSSFSLATLQDVQTYAVDVLCLTGPLCLLITRYFSRFQEPFQQRHANLKSVVSVAALKGLRFSRKLRRDIAQFLGLTGLLTRCSPVVPQSNLFTFT